MADIMSDTLGGMMGGLTGSLSLVAYAILGAVILGGTIWFLWKKGIIWNSQKTICLNWEERGASGDMTLISQDLCGTIKGETGIKYKIRQKNVFVNPPPLQMINRIGSKDLVMFFWADRDEAYPFMPRRFTKDYIVEKATEAFRLKTTEYNEDGTVKKAGLSPQTLEDFYEGLGAMEAGDAIFFKPVVDESSANLVMTEMANVNNMYKNQFLTMIKEWGPTIGVILLAFILIWGLTGVMDRLSNVKVVCDVVSSAAQAATQLPGMPEIP